MYFSTKIYLKPEQWDAKRKMVKNHPNANVLNRMLYENIAAIEQTELGLWQQGKSISLDLLKNSIDKPKRIAIREKNKLIAIYELTNDLNYYKAVRVWN